MQVPNRWHMQDMLLDTSTSHCVIGQYTQYYISLWMFTACSRHLYNPVHFIPSIGMGKTARERIHISLVMVTANTLD